MPENSEPPCKEVFREEGCETGRNMLANSVPPCNEALREEGCET